MHIEYKMFCREIAYSLGDDTDTIWCVNRNYEFDVKHNIAGVVNDV
jgi:hypothetical protein